MSEFLHLRVGRFFDASALGRAQGLAATLEMTARLDELAHHSCRAIEWSSATEAWCDLGSAPPSRFALRRTSRDGLSPWTIADRLHSEIKSLLSVEVACGVASTRSAARAASALARPSGLVVVLPGYESSVLDIATRQGAATAADLDFDATPLRPSFVPRAIVRGAEVSDLDDERLGRAIASLVDEARRGLDALGVLASTVRVQFTSAAGTREAIASLPDATSLGELIGEAADRLARRVVGGSTGPGRLILSLSHLIPGPSQGSLFGWRYDRHGQAAQRLA